MSQQDMFRFNEEAVKSPEIQHYLDVVVQQQIDGLSDRINDCLEEGMRGLSFDLNTYAKCKGYTFTDEESIEQLEKAFPGFRDRIRASIIESTMEFQKHLLAEAK